MNNFGTNNVAKFGAWVETTKYDMQMDQFQSETG